MIIDSLLELSSAQAITADAASTNVIDLKGANLQIGAGKPLWMMFSVGVAADFTTGDETYQFNVETDDNSGFSSKVILVSRAILAATLIAGYQFRLAIPVENVERYIRAFYDVAGTTPTITMDAWLTDQEPQNSKVSYPDAI